MSFCVPRYGNEQSQGPGAGVEACSLPFPSHSSSLLRSLSPPPDRSFSPSLSLFFFLRSRGGE
eukprot:2679470-Pyramimonas_sp.AAC.1